MLWLLSGQFSNCIWTFLGHRWPTSFTNFSYPNTCSQATIANQHSTVNTPIICETDYRSYRIIGASPQTPAGSLWQPTSLSNIPRPYMSHRALGAQNGQASSIFSERRCLWILRPLWRRLWTGREGVHFVVSAPGRRNETLVTPLISVAEFLVYICSIKIWSLATQFIYFKVLSGRWSLT